MELIDKDIGIIIATFPVKFFQIHELDHDKISSRLWELRFYSNKNVDFENDLGGRLILTAALLCDISGYGRSFPPVPWTPKISCNQI